MFLRHFFILIAAIASLAPSHAYALLTRASLIRSVDQHFPLIEKQLLEQAAAAEDIVAAKGNFDFELKMKHRNWDEQDYNNRYSEVSLQKRTQFYGLGLEAGQRQGLGNFPSYEGKYKTSTPGEVYLGLTLPLLRNFVTDKSRTELSQAKTRFAIAQEEVKLKKLYYTYKALSLYYDYQVLNQNLKISKEIYQLAHNRREWLQKKVKAGDSEKIALVDLERTILKRKNDILKIEMELEKVKYQLSLYYRDSNGKSITELTSAYPDVSELEKLTEQLPQLDISGNPTINIVLSQIDLQKQQLKLEQQARRPQLDLKLKAMHNLDYEDMHPARDSLLMGLEFSFPLQNNRAQGKSNAAKLKLQATDKELSFITQEITNQFSFSLKAIKISKERWQTYRKQALASEQVATAQAKRFERGQSDMFTVNIREKELADAKMQKWYAYGQTMRYLLESQILTGKIY